MTTEVGDFFDRSADGYRRTAAGMAPYHRRTAQRLEAELRGRVLALGGLWAQASEELGRLDLVVSDLSLAMLGGYRRAGRQLAAGDGMHLPFQNSTFNHAVLPLVLHHVAGRSAAEARAGVAAVLREVRGVLRPGGKLWISELCIAPALYRVERLLVPLTRRLLARAGEPLVVMHSAAFYRALLVADGWNAITSERIEAPDARPTDWVRPVIALPAFRIPRFLFPLRATLISAIA